LQDNAPRINLKRAQVLSECASLALSRSLSLSLSLSPPSSSSSWPLLARRSTPTRSFALAHAPACSLYSWVGRSTWVGLRRRFLPIPVGARRFRIKGIYAGARGRPGRGAALRVVVAPIFAPTVLTRKGPRAEAMVRAPRGGGGAAGYEGRGRERERIPMPA
jgi:hypothetical protein